MSRLLVASALVLSIARPAHAAMERVAVVVGANDAAPGRKRLRFAHRDARAVASVLRSVGGFGQGQVHLLLDPEPRRVLELLDRELALAGKRADGTLILFYYSGHADTASLYPAGEVLALADLKKRLEDSRAQVRVGLIDACRGGGWTGSKGLSPADRFDLDLTSGGLSEGSVLIASSSGTEDAHESESLRGSFFTHHWNAALRGAADRNRDDQVTLAEAFEYAKALTIRDTALHTDAPQHPSFRVNLLGRADLPLSSLASGAALVHVEQKVGPLQVIHLGTGLIVAEVPSGPRTVTLALAPGRYLVRRRRNRDVLARQIRVMAGRQTRVSEENLVLLGSAQLAVKGPPGSTPPEPTLDPEADPPSEWMLGFAYHRPRYSHDVDNGDGWFTHDEELRWTQLSGGYLWRTGKNWATRFSAGFWVDHWSSSDGDFFLTVGETLSLPVSVLGERVPFISPHVVEPYLAGELKAAFEPGEPGEDSSPVYHHPLQLNLSVAAGLRLYFLYAQVGYGVNFLPQGAEDQELYEGTLYRERLYDPRPGLAVDVGLRWVKNFR